MITRTLVPAALGALGLLAAAASGAAASPPRIYHTATAQSASLDTLAVVDGCLQQEIFVGSTSGHWVGPHDGSNRQDGPTSVFLRVTDLCSGDPGAPAAAPGGVVLEVEAQGMIGLQTDQHLTYAEASGQLSGTDQDGNPVTLTLDAHWTGVGTLEHHTYHSHENLPEGNVSATGNEWSRFATGTVTVSLDGTTYAGDDADSLLTRVKGRCIEVPKGSNPVPGEFFPCFGFPA